MYLYYTQQLKNNIFQVMQRIYFLIKVPKNIRAYQDTQYVMIIGYKSLDI